MNVLVAGREQADPLIGVILAGGLARRMGGGDKCLRRLGSLTLLEHAMARLKAQTDALALNANGDPARFAQFGVEVIGDDVADFPGPLAGVLAGMERAAQLGAKRIVTVAADTPFFPRDLAARLIEAAEMGEKPLALAATREGDRLARQPTFGLWSVDLRRALRRALTERGVRKIVAWTDEIGCATAPFEKLPVGGGLDPFFNVNTPEDLEQAAACLSAIEIFEAEGRA